VEVILFFPAKTVLSVIVLPLALPCPFKHLSLNALLHHDVLISLCFIGAAIGDSERYPNGCMLISSRR